MLRKREHEREQEGGEGEGKKENTQKENKHYSNFTNERKSQLIC